MSLIVAPYDEWAEVEHNGRIIEESIAPGAFGAVRNRARKFTVNLEHDPTRWIGSVLDLDPDDPRGLAGVVKIRRSAEGDQALNDAADELLGASIGMAVAPSDETLRGSPPAHPQGVPRSHRPHRRRPPTSGARVLEVRNAPPPTVIPPVTSATPNLDRILAERHEREYRSAST